MAVITVPGPISGANYKFRVAGDKPTVDEQRWIDARVSQKEQAFQTEYAKAFGAPVETGESTGIANLLGEVPKGLARGAVGFGEQALLGAATLLPEDYEKPTREVIRRGAYELSPQADIGLEDSKTAQISEGVGSAAAVYGLASVPFVGPYLAGAAAVGAGAGEASERARAAGATEGERNAATLKGAAVGALDLVPVLGSIKKRFGPQFTNKLLDYAANILMEGGEEAAQESLTQVLQNMIEQGYDPDQDLGEGTLASAGVGGLAGALIAAIMPGRNHTAPKPAPDANETTGEQPPPAADKTAQTPTPAAPTATAATPDQIAAAANAVSEPDETAVDEAHSEMEYHYKLPRPETEAIYQQVASAPDQEAAIAEVSQQRGLSPDAVRDIYSTIDYAVKRTAPPAVEAVAAPKAPPTKTKQAVTQAVAEINTAAAEGAQRIKTKGTLPGATPVGTKPTTATQPNPVQGEQPAEPMAPTELTTLDKAKALIAETGKTSVPFIQKTLQIPLAEAKAVVGQLEAEGAVSKPNAAGKRTINVAKLAPAPAPQPEVTTNAPSQSGQPDAGADGTGPASGQPSPVGAGPDAVAGGAPAAKAPEPQAVEGGADGAGLVGSGEGGQPDPLTPPAPPQLPNLRAPLVPQPTLKLPEGAEVIGAGQVIPAPIAPVPSLVQPQAERAAAPSGPVRDKFGNRRLRKIEAPVDEAANAAAQAKLDARWEARMAKLDAVVPGSREYFTEAAISTGADPTGPRDKNLIVDLLDESEKRVRKIPNGAAAQRYFQKYRNPGDALEAMAYDVLFSPTAQQFAPSKDQVGTPQAEFLRGTARQQAQAAIDWVNTNLTERSRDYIAEQLEINAAFIKNTLNGMVNTKRDRVQDSRKRAAARKTIEDATALVEKYQEAVKADREAQEKREASRQENEAAKAEARELGRSKLQQQLARGKSVSLAPMPSFLKLMQIDATVGLGFPLHPDVRIALENGNLSGALSALAATTPNPQIAKVSKKLASMVGTTKVRVVEGLTDTKGQPIAGAFDPQTNEILLDAENGTNPHVVLHEMTHAVTTEALAKPGHPVAQRLTALFNNLQSALGSAYGATTVEEFASEAMSNPEFQAKLAQLRENGSNITAWDRFKNIVGNFLRGLVGLPHAKIDALSSATNLIDALMDTAPDTRDAGAYYMIGRDPKAAVATYRQALQNGTNPTKGNLQRASDMIVDNAVAAPRWVTKGALQFTPLHLLVQMAQKHLPSAPRLNELVNEASAALSKMRDTLHIFTEDLNTYARKVSPEERDMWNEMAHDSTFYEVDPSLDEKAAEKKYGKNGDPENKLAQYDRLRAMYLKLSPEGRTQYQKSLNIFRTLRERARQSIDNAVKELFPNDPATADRIMRTFFARLEAKGTIDPYLPLNRDGEYWLTMNVFDTNTKTMEVFSTPFQSERERAEAQKALEDQAAADMVKYLGRTEEQARAELKTRLSVGRSNPDFSNVPPQSFVARLMDQLRKANVDPEVMRAVTNLVIDTMPETAYAKTFRSRKGILGADLDMVKAITEKATSVSRQVVQTEYRGKFQRLKAQLTKEYDADPVARNSLGARDMLDQLHKVADFAASPTRPKWSQVATNAGFLMTLGFNPSSALLNFVQLPGIVLPYFGGKYGFNEARRAMREARIAMMRSGRTREVETITETGTDKQRVKAGYSLSNYNFDDPKLDARTKRLKYLVEEGTRLGQFNRSQVYDILDLDGVEGIGTKFNAASGFMMHHSERMVREITLASAYQLEVDRMAKAKKGALTEADYRAAAQEAVRLTEDTNGGVAAAATPSFAHSGFGSVVFMYKRFAVTMYGLLLKTAHQAVKGQSAEAKKIARYQLGGIYGATALLSGVAGLPLYGTLAAVFNLFRDDEDENFETITRRYVHEGAYHGLVNYLTGVNIATRIGLSDLLFRESLVERDQSALWTLAEQLGGPVVGTVLNVERGARLIADGEIQRGVESIVPAALRAPLRAFRFGTEGATTMDGKEIVDDITPVQAIAQALGFNPASYQLQLEKNAAGKKFERAILERRSKLVDQYFYAYFNGDTATMQEVVDDMYDFNTDYPEISITGKTLQDSQRQRTNSRQNAYHGLTLNDKLRPRIISLMEGT